MQVTKEQILAQLKKEGVNNLDQFADFLVQKTHPNGDPTSPVTNAAIVYQHGFVSH